jgi:cobalt/nickel transport system permease protein/cobalt/nickel transport protein
VRSRTFLVVGLLAALLVAGVASFYASSHPDGLEYVAEQTGFLDQAEDSPAVDSPLADYSTEGVDDERLSGGLAGVIGSLAVLLLAGGMFWALRRRTPPDEGSEHPEPTPADSEV